MEILVWGRLRPIPKSAVFEEVSWRARRDSNS
jgi:hypothetical protein